MNRASDIIEKYVRELGLPRDKIRITSSKEEMRRALEKTQAPDKVKNVIPEVADLGGEYVLCREGKCIIYISENATEYDILHALLHAHQYLVVGVFAEPRIDIFYGENVTDKCVELASLYVSLLMFLVTNLLNDVLVDIYVRAKHPGLIPLMKKDMEKTREMLENLTLHPEIPREYKAFVQTIYELGYMGTDRKVNELIKNYTRKQTRERAIRILNTILDKASSRTGIRVKHWMEGNIYVVNLRAYITGCIDDSPVIIIA